MKVLHLASSNRWTGAAAPALAETEALLRHGVEAFFGFVGGYRLEDRLRRNSFAFPLIEKKQNPLSLGRSVRALETLIRERGIDIVHAHLTYDHFLAVRLSRRTGVRIVRTFHSARTLRRDPFSEYLRSRTNRFCVVNETFLPRLASRGALFTPPPVNHQVFHPDGPSARTSLGIPDEVPVVGVIGKVAPDRGFEDALRSFALLSHAGVKLVVIGHGAHQRPLESLSRRLGIEGRVVWAGYHEEDLVEHFRALDVMMFTKAGSDEGHRAVTEAMACGVPVACYPVPGIDPILGELAPRFRAAESTPSALAEVVGSLLGRKKSLRSECLAATELSGYGPTVRRLVTVYQRVLQPSG